MRSRVLSFVLLALAVVVALVGMSACTRAKPNRPAALAPTSAPLPTVAMAETRVPSAATKVAAAPLTSTVLLGNVTPVPLEPSPTMVPGMPTSTVNPPAPVGSEPAPAVTLIVPLTPQVESTPVPAPGAAQPQAEQPGAAANVPTKAYKVQSGDTLFGIAVRFGTTVETLKQLNNLPNDMLTVGQDLQIPIIAGSSESAAPAAPGAVAPQAVAPAAPAAPAAPRQAAAGSRVHVVKPGENLFRIALSYGVSLEAVAQANNITPPWYTIYVGQRLVIP
jgi:LysM repeat protein